MKLRPFDVLGIGTLLAGTLALLICAVLLMSCGGGGGGLTTNTNTPITGAPNQLGTVTAVQSVTCPTSTVVPPVVGTACMDLTVSCPKVPDYNQIHLKVSQPSSGVSKGTVIYTTGGGGNALYETMFLHGNDAINPVIAAGFTVVQTNFSDTNLGSAGWLDDPVGGSGPLLTSCRWATTAQWIHDNVRSTNTAFCATGNSGGAGVIAYALSRYGEDAIFNYVLPTSGPPFSRIDYGCLCQQTTETSVCSGVLDTCYGLDANKFLDPSYNNTNCSSRNPVDLAKWQGDSILSSDNKSVFNYKTKVHFIFGGMDFGSGAAEAVLWKNAITSQEDAECVASAPHLIADDPTGAATIANDLIAGCQ